MLRRTVCRLTRYPCGAGQGNDQRSPEGRDRRPGRKSPRWFTRPMAFWFLSIAAIASPEDAVAAACGMDTSDRSPPAPVMQPTLLRHRAGSGYFAGAEGRAVFLRGSHTWTNNISFSTTGQFDFDAYLKVLSGQGANLIRYWNWPAAQDALIEPFEKNAKGKWDLTKFNEAYFHHVAANADAAAAKGMYLSVMAFFDYDPEGRYGWKSSVWNGANNVNGTTRSNRAVEQSDRMTLGLQKAYLAKLLNTLGRKPNVLWEIANEPQNSQATVDWEDTLVTFIHRYQAEHGLLAQPVGITANYPEGNHAAINPMLNATGADWISPHGWEDYQSGSPVNTGGKVQLIDSDHTFGIGGDGNWVWRQFTRGHGGVLIMDDMAGTGLSGVFKVPGQHRASEEAARRALKEIATVLQVVDITGMAPHGELASSGYALADPARGKYIAMANGNLKMNLSGHPPRPLQGCWIDIKTGQITDMGVVSSGNTGQSFDPPYSDAILLLLPPK
jgi:hypothetical protein